MTPDRWQEIKRLFDAALARTPDGRDSYLAEACRGDAGLREELESLLAAHERPGHLSGVLGVRILVTGSRLGPYEILSMLGAGGMGEVYKARDTRLDRSVAIKVLPPGVTSDPAARQRLEREARAAAALAHPHICMLLDIGREEDLDYLVMEYLDGETLAARLARGTLPRRSSCPYAIQIAEALDAAHQAGIVHRDLKPGNVMLDEGWGQAPRLRPRQAGAAHRDRRADEPRRSRSRAPA